MLKKDLKIIFISSLIAVASSVTAFGADINDVYNDVHYMRNNLVPDISSLNSMITSSNGGWLTMMNYLSNMNTKMNTYLPDISSIKNSISSVDTKLSTTNTNLASVINAINSSNALLTSVNSNTSMSASNTSFILSGLTATLPDIKDSVVQLQQVLASDEDLAIRQDQASRVDAISDDFLSSSGDASVSLGDIGSAKDSITNIKDSLSGGASQSQLWTILGSGSDAWSWFSQSVADDLDQSGSQSRLRSSGSSTPYLDDYYRQVYNSLGGDYND